MQIGSGTKDVNVEHTLEDFEDHSLGEELRSCQHFLVDSELDRARRKKIQLRTGNSQRNNRERET